MENCVVDWKRLRESPMFRSRKISGEKAVKLNDAQTDEAISLQTKISMRTREASSTKHEIRHLIMSYIILAGQAANIGKVNSTKKTKYKILMPKCGECGYQVADEKR